ncbi:MAG: inositol monophosphatase family protein [bacterium]
MFCQKKKIYQIIKQNFSDHNIVGEELYKEKSKSDYCWIIDPLDGTNNYAYNYPFFCTSIGLTYKEEVILGVIFDPLKNELFEASIIDSSAFLNGKEIKVNSVNNIAKAKFSTGFCYHLEKMKDNNIDHFQKVLFSTLGLRIDGAAALDLCYVACGRSDGYWEIGLKSWDMVAGKIIVEKAKGIATDIKGEKFSLNKDNILVTNKKLHSQVLEVMWEKKSFIKK